MIRVLKGNPDDAELAAVTVVLLAAARAAEPTGTAEPARWHGPKWTIEGTGPWRRPRYTVLSWRGHRKG